MFFNGAKFFHSVSILRFVGEEKKFILGNKNCTNAEGLAFIKKKNELASIQRERNGSMGKIQV